MIAIGSLFSGVGLLDLGLELALGASTVWQVERDPYARQVLARHFPRADRSVDDVRRIEPPCVVDVLCGGFPCQGASDAGLRLGLADPRTGLWFEMEKWIRALEPRIVVFENVRGLRRRGLDRVLGDLVRAGYAVEWSELAAATCGAPHRRARLFGIAWRDERAIAHVEAIPEHPDVCGVVDGDGYRETPPWSTQVFSRLTPRDLKLWPTRRPISPPLGMAVRLADNGVDLARAVKLWPTILASDHKGPQVSVERREAGSPGLPLSLAVKLWPTATASDADRGAWADRIDTKSTGARLIDSIAYAERQAVKLWTATAGDAKASGSRCAEGSEAHAGVSLTDAALGNGARGRDESDGRILNPAWVERLMGAPPGWTELASLFARPVEHRLQGWGELVDAGPAVAEWEAGVVAEVVYVNGDSVDVKRRDTGDVEPVDEAEET